MKKILLSGANEATQRGTAIIRLTLRGFKTNSGKVDEKKLKKIESGLCPFKERHCVCGCMCVPVCEIACL